VSNDSFQFCQQLLEDTGVAVTPGCDFGEHRAEQYIRLAYTSSEDRLREGMQRLQKFISQQS
jgi:aspartate/methionine/tyrosine aminotransferase